ncbi:glyoxalase/bleomycin resistance/dioxygenase family protein [Phocea massiliensis]|uniref:Glyoxalase-like domain protein n=1 Tax=uncultured Anaerotruncus sp. TaxID=905011 RepID=A0A6N2UYF8_9FIRM|nr:VOC family protein [Merdimmobilis hominis]MCD4837188.1 glyoxalase/bleomycin resistance/dioxygenase family protein [Merdimmobilis hominis]
MDLGRNVTVSGGFAVQEGLDWLLDIPKETMVWRPRNMELYFEVEDFDAFLEKLAAYPEVEQVHPPKKHEWQQRVARIFDPDGHIIEIGESMKVIAQRYLRMGCSVEETAQIIQHLAEFVESCLREVTPNP